MDARRCPQGGVNRGMLCWGADDVKNAAIVALVATIAACGGDGTGPEPAPPKPTTLEVVAGDGQSAPAGAAVPEELVVRVLDQRDDPLQDVTVAWSLVDSAGPGAALGASSSVTATDGRATNTFTLGTAEGDYVVEARVMAIASPAPFSFTATSVPTIAGVSPDPAREGFPATIIGTNFVADPAGDTVVLDGLEAAVTAATSTRLDVRLPAGGCRPARDSAEFAVDVGGVRSAGFFHPVVPADSTVAALGPAAAAIRSDSAEIECLQVPARPGGGGYLIVPAVAATTPSVTAPERLTRRVGSDSVFGTGGFDIIPGGGKAGGDAAASTFPVALLPDVRAERRVRLYERSLQRRFADAARRAFGRAAGGPGAASRTTGGPAAAAPGDTIQLKVTDINASNLCTTFDTIAAVVKSVGTFGIALEDTAAPALGFSQTDYDQFVAEFDSKTYPTDTTYFGGPSDLDGNGAVYLVFTPQVNKATERGSQTVTAGFFFAGDLFPASGTNGCPASNEGELVYLLVPDPTGQFSDRRGTSTVRRLSRGTLAHEFQHLINAATRILETGGPPEDLWLDEGLSHLAEEVVGYAVTGLGPGSNLTYAQAHVDPGAFDAFFRQNFVRLSVYLDRPDSVSKNSPIQDDADLATRGATWSFLRWTLDQTATSATEAAVTRALVHTTETGVDNLASAVGASFDSLLPGWLLALYADDFVSGVDPAYQVASWDLRDVYQNGFGGYPLTPQAIAYSDGTTDFSIVAGSGRYFLLSAGSTSPALALRFSDRSGSPLSRTALDPRLLVLRLP